MTKLGTNETDKWREGVKLNHTLIEIQNQPVAWRQTLEVVDRNWSQLANSLLITPATHALFIGCGTSYYLAQSAARLYQQVTGCISHAIPASEIFLAPTAVLPQGVPVVAFAISRSGSTSEVLLAVDHLRRHFPHVQIIGVTCDSNSALARRVRYSVALDHASERSVVMTQSFTSMLLALQGIAARIAGRQDLLEELEQLPKLLEEAMGAFSAFGRRLGESDDYHQFIYLGLGAYYGLAAEATLKLKEMTQVRCESYNPLEFRHGPISVVERGTAVVALAGSGDFKQVKAVLEDVRRYGGAGIILAPATDVRTLSSDLVCPVPDSVSDWSRTPLYMPALHHLALSRALRLGLNPDKPRNLSQVVVLDLKQGGAASCL
jgi:glucosamine--fructose-6-phosphate aminotransferase (isomerizing)